MLNLLLMLGLVAPQPGAPKMEGAKLQPGERCYAIVMGDKTLGSTWQVIKPATANGKPAWDITVHQRAAGGRFDMRDHFVIARDSLLPIRMESWRGADRTSQGWHRVKLDYAGNRVRGTKEDAKGKTAIDVPLAGPTWEGNLWGVTFAAAPLRKDARMTLPFWQYDKGQGTYTIRVIGSEDVDVPGTGKVAAWIVEAGDDPAQLMRYTIAKAPRAELGYTAGPGGQRLGGSCGEQAVATFSD